MTREATSTIKTAPHDRPILVYWLGFWRPIQWQSGKTKAGEGWKCLCGCNNIDLDPTSPWIEMPKIK